MKKRTQKKRQPCACGNLLCKGEIICGECSIIMKEELDQLWKRELVDNDDRNDQKFHQDAGKPRLDLIPQFALLSVGEVLEYGTRKYTEKSWPLITEGRKRFLASALRHINAYMRDEMNDPESNLPHLAHAITNLLFVLELNLKH